ncbi:MAG: hypothetical protein E7418_05220 [Ruminococcaceae bacterium]|nr:hypothetical protein [Oscillospiraceae bacterium]
MKERGIKKATASCIPWLLAAFLPYFLYGFAYFPVLDDFIQYGCYPAYENLSHVYLTIGTLSIRPLAGLLDPAFWGLFWEVPGIALCLIVLLHVASGFLLGKALENFSLKPSPLFLALYLLFPLGMEGRYWLSASTRLVVGLFFATTSIYFYSRYASGDKLRYLWFFSLFQLISCGFYESVTVFSAGVACLLFLYRPAKRNLPAVLFSIFHVGLMFTYYKLFADLGAMGSRATAGFSLERLPGQIVYLVLQLQEMVVPAWKSLTDGFTGGLRILCTSGFWGYCILFCMLVVSVCLAAVTREDEKRDTGKKSLCFLIGGFLLFGATLVPNLLSEEVWLTNRSLFIPLIGLFFLLDAAVIHLPLTGRRVLIFICLFVCMIASVNEYDVYRRVSEQDTRLVDQVAEQLSEKALAGEEPIQVVLKKEVTTQQNALYKDHVKSVFDADWSLTGALRERLNNLQLVCNEPIVTETAVEKTDCFVVYVD